MARRTKTYESFLETKKLKSRFLERQEYTARYRADHPLLQGRVPARIYKEAQRRARDVDFTLSKWLGYWLELTFREHPTKEDA